MEGGGSARLKEKKVYQRWLQESPWGHLFEEYRRVGHRAERVAVS